VDRTHSDYIVAGLEAGLRVITEKPLTTDFDKARQILDTVERTGNHPTVTFNYRYSPIATTFSELIGSGAIGDVVSVHFEWLLDTSHGADYFRRWHRDKANSGGLMIHKASHHFDLINWSIRQQPEEVMGYGRRAFYGKENGERLGLRHDYERASGSTAAAGDPFAIDLSSTEQHRDLYLAAEQADGYIRDQNVFGDGITIEDDMAVLVKYRQGATLTYHLTAYSPWEGYRFMVNGTKGRLELESNESVWTRPRTGTSTPVPAIHGTEAAENAGGTRILLRPHWQPPREVPVVFDHAGHGGGDVRLLTDLFGPEPDSEIAPSDPALRLQAGEVDGVHAMAIGAAANLAFTSGQPVRIAEALGRDI
jgi:predicted dehydrogenase